jgi:hypothetical protein
VRRALRRDRGWQHYRIWCALRGRQDDSCGSNAAQNSSPTSRSLGRLQDRDGTYLLLKTELRHVSDHIEIVSCRLVKFDQRSRAPCCGYARCGTVSRRRMGHLPFNGRLKPGGTGRLSDTRQESHCRWRPTFGDRSTGTGAHRTQRRGVLARAVAATNVVAPTPLRQ